MIVRFFKDGYVFDSFLRYLFCDFGVFMAMFRMLKKWTNNNDAVAAIEFALVGIPFFVVLIGTLEITLFFAAGNVLEGAAQTASRVIRTGQAQQSGDAEAMFKDALCSQIGILVPCADIKYEVIEIPDDSFAGVASFPPSFDEDGNLESQGFAAGGVESVVLVRLSYTYKFMSPFLGSIMDEGFGNNSYRHMATVVIRNEPYAFE